MTAIRRFIADLHSVVRFSAQWVLNFSAELASAFRLLFLSQKGHREQPSFLSSIRSHVRTLCFPFLYLPLQLILTCVSLVLHAITNLLNRKIPSYAERGLSEAEQQYLYAIFADNLCYKKIQLQFGGVKERLKISPQAVGNEIFLRKKWGTRLYYDDLSLSDEGLRLLGHEACHVWQFQNGGAKYIGDSLITQICIFLGNRIPVHLSHGYNILPPLRDNVGFENCNVEQQAVIAELIGLSCAAFDVSELSRNQFCKVSGISLNETEFDIVSQAHRYLQRSTPRAQT